MRAYPAKLTCSGKFWAALGWWLGCSPKSPTYTMRGRGQGGQAEGESKNERWEEGSSKGMIKQKKQKVARKECRRHKLEVAKKAKVRNTIEQITEAERGTQESQRWNT